MSRARQVLPTVKHAVGSVVAQTVVGSPLTQKKEAERSTAPTKLVTLQQLAALRAHRSGFSAAALALRGRTKRRQIAAAGCRHHPGSPEAKPADIIDLLICIATGAQALIMAA